MKFKKLMSGLLSASILATMFVPVHAETNETTKTQYFNNTVKITKFGGSITAPDDASHWTQKTAHFIANTYGNGSYEMTNYAVGGATSVTGLANCVQAFNAVAENREEAPDIVFIEYAVNDSNPVVKTTFTEKTVTAGNATVVKYDTEKNDINIYDADKGTYEVDYYNENNPTGAHTATNWPSGHYSISVDEAELAKEKLRIEEMVRLAQNLPSKPAVFLVNVGLGLTLGDRHQYRPNFPGVTNSIAREYNELATSLGIGYIDVENAMWKYIENEIGKQLETDTSKTRDEVRNALQLELYGDNSSIHPTTKASEQYAKIIEDVIKADPDNFLKHKETINYTETNSYSTDTHVIPYTAGEYSGNWTLVNNGERAYSYGMSTTVEGASVSFKTSGAQLGIVASNSGNYSYKIYDNTDNKEIVTSSANAKGLNFFDESNDWNNTKLNKDHNYTVTLTKGNDGNALTVYGIMANMTKPTNGYTSYTDYNKSKYTPYAEQSYDFEPKSGAVDTTQIGTYFSDVQGLSYTDGATVSYDGNEKALKFTAAKDKDKFTVKLNSDFDTKIINISFDLKFDSNGKNGTTGSAGNIELTPVNCGNIFKIVPGSNLASVCMNSGSYRFSNKEDCWWKNKASDGNYHNIRLRLTPNSGGKKTIALWIDGEKGDTEYTESNKTTYTALDFILNKANDTFCIDNIRIYDEVAEVVKLIDAIGTVSLDKEAAIKEARERANYVIAKDYAVSNITTLEAAEETLKALKNMLTVSSVFSPFVGSDIVYDYTKEYTVSKVEIDGTEKTKDTDWDAKDGRLLIKSSALNSAKDYALKVTFTKDGSNAVVDQTLTVYANESKIIKAFDLTEGSYEHNTGNSNTEDNTKVWSKNQSGWASWSELNSQPWYLRMDTTKSITDGEYYFTFKDLPKGNYKVEYAKYGSITEQRIPLIDVKSGNVTLKNQNPYSSNKNGYLDLGMFDFTKDNTLTVSASATQRTQNATDAIMCVYGIKLTPMPTAAAEITSYFTTGTTVLDAINSAANAEQLKIVVEENSEYLGVDKAALGDMSKVYEELVETKTYASLAAFKAAFENAVSAQLTKKESVLVRSLEDLKNINEKYYIRTQSTFSLTSGDSTPKSRPAYLSYKVAGKNLKKAEISFKVSKKGSIKLEVANNTIPNVSGLANGGTSEEIASYISAFTAVKNYEKTTTEQNETVTVDLTELIAQGKEDITIRFTSTVANQGISEVKFLTYYDETNITPSEYYTIDKVSFVNCVNGKNESEQCGFLGSVMITKNKSDAPVPQMIVAAYNNDGRLEDVKVCDNATLDGKVTVNWSTVFKPAKIKVFLWSNDELLIPYANCFVINAPTNTDATNDSGSLWYKPDGTTEQP